MSVPPLTPHQSQYYAWLLTHRVGGDSVEFLASIVKDRWGNPVINPEYNVAERWPNLTLKKIPKMVLARREWGHDDYRLNVANLSMAQPEPEAPSPRPAPKVRGRKATVTRDLFGAGGEDA